MHKGWMQIFRNPTLVPFALASVIGVMMSIHPEVAESNAAAWLEYFGLSSWGEGFASSTDEWILGVCIVVGMISIFSLAYSLFWCDSDAVAVKRNPGNGWRVSRLIMCVWTIRKAEGLCRDFLAQPQKTEEVRVLVAYALRQHRAEGGTKQGSWKFWVGLLGAEEQYGADAVRATVTKLDEEFPPSWLTQCWMKCRQRREEKYTRIPRKSHKVWADPASFHFHIPEPSVTLTPPPWKNPIRRIRSEWRRRRKRETIHGMDEK